nr:PREDICTED: uncharacterized protein LOC109032624 isoform X1 [Bemisia tabaci]
MIISLDGFFALKISLWLFCPLVFDGAVSQSLNATTVKGPPWRILFFGSDDFSLRTLSALTDEFKQSKKLISKLDLMFIDDEDVVWKYAYEHRINRIAYPPEFPTELRDKYDVGIVVSFGEILQDDLIPEFPLGILESHPSLLPRWRGETPIPHALMHGDKETGVTIIKVKPLNGDHEGFDAGDIVKQMRTQIGPHEFAPELHNRLADESANLVMDVIKNLPKIVQKPKPQETKNVTFAPLLQQEMSWVVWKNWTAEQIYNRHRALSHVWPVATIWKCFVVKFHNFTVVPAAEAIGLDIIVAATKPPTSTPKMEEEPHNLQANPGNLQNPDEAPGEFLDMEAEFGNLGRILEPEARSGHLHVLQVKMGQQGTGYRRKPKRITTRRPRGRPTTTPSDSDEELFGAVDLEAAQLPNVTDTHETPKQAWQRWVKKVYQPPTTLDPRNIPPETWLKPGLVLFDWSVQALRVMCVGGGQLLVPSVTVSRRKTMDALSFHNGFLSRTKPYYRVFSEYGHFKGEDSTRPPWDIVTRRPMRKGRGRGRARG